MDKEDQKLIDYIDNNKEEICTLVRKLVSISSINIPGEKEGQQLEIGNFIYKKFQEIGLNNVRFQDVYPGAKNVLGETLASSKKTGIIFNGHMDTVNVNNMKIDPFRGSVIDGKIYGRGTADMKSGLAAAIFAVKAILDLNINLSKGIFLTAVVDEESSGRGINKLISEGIQAEYGIVGEPTCYGGRLKIAIAHKGRAEMEVTVKGKASHGCAPELGINAISRMCEVIQAIEKELPKKLSLNSHPLLGTGTINVGVINGGTQSNIVPDTCTIKIDRRILPGEDLEDVQNEIEDILEKLRKKDSKLNVSVKPTKNSLLRRAQPMEISPDEKIAKMASLAIEQVTGAPGLIWGSPGYTDASPMVNKAKIPTIVLGPGRVGHTQDEHVHIDEVITCTKVYALIMKSICK